MTHAHADTVQKQRDRDSAEKCCKLIVNYWAARGKQVTAWVREEHLSNGNGTYHRVCADGIPPGAKE